VVGPYLYTYKETFEKLLMTTLLIPIINDGKFIGSFGIDILLQDLDNELSEVHPYEKGYLMLFSNTGVVVSHPNKSFIGKNITEVMPKREEEFHILNSIQNGNQFSFTWTDEYKNLGKTTTVFIPIQIGDNNEKKWSLGVVMPNDMIFSETNKVKFISVVICIVALLILSALIVIIATKISSSISTIITRLNKIFNIDFTKDGMVKSNNELDTINEYLNNLSVYETNLISNLISNLILQSNLITESTTKLVIILNTIIRHREDKNEKGLAVVVNEIKELSEVFDKASKEISGLIISVESHSNKVFKVMKEIISVTTKMNETTQYISSSINEIIQYVSSTSIGQQTEYKSETLQQLTKTYGSNQLSFEDDDHVVKNLTIYIKVSEDLTDYSTQLSKFAKDLYVDLKGYKKD
jgi:methyl-accepting chemotaxis protein